MVRIYNAETFPAANITFVREHGTHTFALASGSHVTAISQPSWEQFAGALARVESPGRFVLSPELITASPEPTPAEMAALPERIAGRVAQVQEWSTGHPDTTVVLGSLAFTQTLPRNVVHFISGGETIGTNPKMPFLSTEAAIFHQAYNPAEHRQPNPQTVAMVCSDVLFHHWQGEMQQALPNRDLSAEYRDPIGPDVTTVLVSGQWATPYDSAITDLAYEEPRYMDPLKFEAGRLMNDYPAIQDVIMCDQMPPGTTTGSGPFTFHAQRA